VDEEEVTAHKNTVDPHDNDELRRRYSYDPDSGIVTRRVRSYRWKENTPVGCLGAGGYLRWKTRGKQYPLTHLIWAIYVGAWPAEQIDHINGDRTDNRARNLREATHSQQMTNRRAFSGKAVPLKGVRLDKSGARFQSRVTKDGVTRSLGTFDTPEEAHAAYAAAAELQHGVFRRLT
jgi:hypothetical protein